VASPALPAQAEADHPGHCLQRAAAVRPDGFLKLEYIAPSREGTSGYETGIGGADGRGRTVGQQRDEKR
jgi:hypothetical protein